MYINNFIQKQFACESMIGSKPDYIINLDTWKRERNKNILFVTGLSGSGKTTLSEEYEKKYNAKMFEIDGIEHNYDSTNIGLLEKAKQKIPEYNKILTIPPNKRNNKEAFALYDKVYNYIINEMTLRSNILFVVEGVQLFQFIDINYIKDKPLIIKNTSAFMSLLRRLKRSGNGKINWLDTLNNEFKELVGMYISDEKQLKNFKSNIK